MDSYKSRILSKVTFLGPVMVTVSAAFWAEFLAVERFSAGRYSSRTESKPGRKAGYNQQDCLQGSSRRGGIWQSEMCV